MALVPLRDVLLKDHVELLRDLCHERRDVLEEAVLVWGGAYRRDRSAPVVDISSDDPCSDEGRPPTALSVSLLPSESDILGEAPPREFHELLGDRVRHSERFSSGDLVGLEDVDSFGDLADARGAAAEFAQDA